MTPGKLLFFFCNNREAMENSIVFESFLCGLHEVYSRTMLRPDLFIYLFVYESREPVTWSSVYGAIVLLVRVIFSSDRVKS